MKYSFRNDYSEVGHPEILKVLLDNAYTQNTGYGFDGITNNLEKLVSNLCENDVITSKGNCNTLKNCSSSRNEECLTCNEDMVIGIACEQELGGEVLSLYRAEHQLIVKGKDRLKIPVPHFACRQVVGTARLEKSAAQGDLVILAPLLHACLKIESCGKVA